MLKAIKFYNVNCLQYFLISFLAMFNEDALFIFSGALFHSLAESLLKLIFAATEFASSFHVLIELGLITLWVSTHTLEAVTRQLTGIQLALSLRFPFFRICITTASFHAFHAMLDYTSKN